MLLIAPTGAGKTLAGFLPALTDLCDRPKRKPGEAHRGIHTLYISPLKALAVDIERNLAKPVGEMGLPVTIETRTGDTPAHKRQRQKLEPPDILLTTPEQLALLIASADARRFFEDLRYVVLDELHSLVTSKRGHLLALGLARLRGLVPGLQAIGLSATVAEPDELRRWLVGQNPPGAMAGSDHRRGRRQAGYLDAGFARARAVAGPFVALCHSGDLRPVKAHKTSLLFVNTRSQAELLFQELWRINEDSLPIALHHGSLDVASAGASRRRWRPTACAPSSRPRRSTSASTGAMSISSSMSARRRAPAGWRSASAAPTTAWTNRPRRSSCRPTASRCWNAAPRSKPRLGAQDTPPLVEGALDVLAQHVLGTACAAPFDATELYRGSSHGGALCQARPRDIRPRRRFRRHRRLCAEDL